MTPLWNRGLALELSAVLALVSGTAACSGNGVNPEERIPVTGRVSDAQSNTRLLFYDEELRQVDVVSVLVRQDGTYGPLQFTRGTFLGAGTAAGFTTGEFESFTIAPSDTSKEVNFDLDPITVPLAVGNRWDYDETIFLPAPATRTVTVEVTAEQAGEAGTVYTVEERRTDPSTGAGETLTYFLAVDNQGARKSADAVIDASDELLLRLPATLGTTWSTVDFSTAAALTKVITGFSCDEDGCVEVNDFTIAQEPAGIFMSVAERHLTGEQVVVTIFTDIGIVDSFVQDTVTGALVSQRKLRAFSGS